GFHDPHDFCQANPDIALTCARYGELNDAGTPQDALIQFNYDVPAPNVVVGVATAPMASTNIADFNDVGSIYGLAYDGSDEVLYAAAYVKRHVNLGSDGIGAIYRIDPAAGTTVLHADLDALDPGAVGVAPDRSVADTPTPLFHDADAYLKTGTTGMGDIEISPDDETLYIVNMAAQELHLLPADPTATITASDLDTFDIPHDCSNAADARPMGLGYHNGQLYVGVVCSAQTIADGLDPAITNDIAFVQSAQFDTIFGTEFKADVFAFDIANEAFDATPVLSVPLNYNRGCIYVPNVTPADQASNCLDDNLSWRPWQSDWQEVFSANASGGLGVGADLPFEYPQPLLADIEFDGDDMILGFRDLHGDRAGDQLGVPSTTVPAAGYTQDQTFRANGFGDILRACVDANGDYVLESNGTCGPITTAGADNGQGPGLINSGSAALVGSGEYYWNDQAPGGFNTIAAFDTSQFASRNAVHDQTVIGSLVQLAGEDDVLATMVEVSNYYNAGLSWFDNETGESVKRNAVFPSEGDDPTATNIPANANALGDLEAFCAAAPIEIGNYVWEDSDGDGVQDPNEPPLAGIEVELQGDTFSAIAVTDANGYFSFSSDATRTDTASALYGLDIQPRTSYTVRVEIANQVPLANLTVTSGNANSGTNSDSRDSDGILSGNFSQAFINTGTPGEHNHTVDFGFTSQIVADRGDLLDTYGTTIGANGAAHELVDETRLGSCVDADINGIPSLNANGDDNEDTGGLDGSGTCITAGDDEDGVAFDTVLDDDTAGVICTTFDINMLGNLPPNAADGFLNMWVDLNADGDFDPNEQVVANNVVDGTLAVADTLTFPAPAPGDLLPLQTVRQINDVIIPCDQSLVGQTIGLRFRFTAGTGVGGESPTGLAANGEVEDYVLDIYGWDFGDAPECTEIPGYACDQTTAGSLTDYLSNLTQQQNGARHVVVPGSPTLGETTVQTTIDTEITGQPSTQNGVNNGGDGDDENGYLGVVSSGAGFESWGNGNGGSLRVQVDNVDATLGACVYGWLDWDQDGFALGTNNGSAVSYTQADGEVRLTFPDPGIFDGVAPNKEVYLRVRVVPGNGVEASCQNSIYDGTTPGLNPGPIGAAVGGEVEDYYLQFTPTSVTLRQINVVDPRTNLLIFAVLIGLSLSTAGFLFFTRRLRKG
ncbi:MAG: GEVED domain-containing protein, partial [Chloroflexota bacterium]